MPYRESSYEQPCAVCEAMTATRCRRCGAHVCTDHATAFQFYVPAYECADRTNCRPSKRPCIKPVKGQKAIWRTGQEIPPYFNK